jgi:hypothetical protein
VLARIEVNHAVNAFLSAFHMHPDAVARGESACGSRYASKAYVASELNIGRTPLIAHLG